MPPKGMNPKQKRMLVIGGGGALLALMFFLSRGSSAAPTAAPTDPATAATFAPPTDSSGGADLSGLMSSVSQLGAGQQQLGDAIVGGQQQLADLIGGLQLGGAAALAPAPASSAATVAAPPVAHAGAHNQPDSKPGQRAPSQIHLRVADARAAAPQQVKSTTNKTIADRARQHPDWGPHTLAAGHRLTGHSDRF